MANCGDRSLRLLRSVMAVVWLILAWQTVLRTGTVIVDGFQSTGAVAATRQPGQLFWPMVGDFLGYDHCWGFHWFGWLWLRSLTTWAVPWSPGVDLLLMACLWLGAAWLCGTAAARFTAAAWAGALAQALVLAMPVAMIAAQSYRPELPAAVLLTWVATRWQRVGWAGRLARGLPLLALPCIHPLGLVVPACWLATAVLFERRALRRCVAERWSDAVALVVGAGLFVLWFALQPQAWAQFQANVTAQRQLAHAMGFGFDGIFRLGLTTRPALMSWPVIGVGSALAAVVLWEALAGKAEAGRNSFGRLAAAAWFGALLFCVVTRNPNALHLTAVFPFVGALAAVAVHRMVAAGRAPRLVGYAVAAVVVGALALLPAKRLILLGKHRAASYREVVRGLVGSLPQARHTYIPVAMWEAAIAAGGTGAGYRFSTFPNLLDRANREEFELAIFRDVTTGDLLVIDPLQEKAGVFNSYPETAMRQTLVVPDGSSDWELVAEHRLPFLYSQGQSERFLVYRRR